MSPELGRVIVVPGPSPEQPALVRCPKCLGLRSVSYRNRGSVALCPDCRRGEVVPRETFRDWWLERFSAEECAVMARAIWGADRVPFEVAPR